MTTLRASPFVMEILENDTTLRSNATIYVSSSAGWSFDVCDTMTSAAKALYAPAYMRKLFASIVRGTA
jgi:hypothetical protein